MQNFIGYGLPPINGAYFQKFNLRVSSREKIKLVINGGGLSYFNDFIHNSSRMKLATDTFSSKLPILFISEEKADSLLKVGGLETGYSKTIAKVAKKGKP